MKNLKKRNILLIALLISFIIIAISFEAKILETDRIIIDNSMSKNKIELIQETLIEKDISLTFSELTFNAKGIIQSVKGGVNRFASSGTFSTNDLDKIIIVKGVLGIEIQVFSKRKSGAKL